MDGSQNGYGGRRTSRIWGFHCTSNCLVGDSVLDGPLKWRGRIPNTLHYIHTYIYWVHPIPVFTAGLSKVSPEEVSLSRSTVMGGLLETTSPFHWMPVMILAWRMQTDPDYRA